MILMLTSLDSISWNAVDYVYAFPMDFTDPDKTNGHGVDVFCQYALSFDIQIRPDQLRIGYYVVSAEITYNFPFAAEPCKHITKSKFDINCQFLREHSWNEVLAHFQNELLSVSFWSDRRADCEAYLLDNPPTK